MSKKRKATNPGGFTLNMAKMNENCQENYRTELEKFRDMAKGKTRPDDVIKVISVLNAGALAIMGPDGRLSKEKEDEFVELALYLEKNVFSKEDMLRAAFENWGTYPLVYRIGFVVLEERQSEEAKKMYLALPEEKKQQVGTMYSFLAVDGGIYSMPVDMMKKNAEEAKAQGVAVEYGLLFSVAPIGVPEYRTRRC